MKSALVPIACLLLCGLVPTQGCERTPPKAPQPRSLKTPADLDSHCQNQIGKARIVEVTPSIWVAIGFDLGNTILVRTAEGNVVIDTMMSPARAAEAKRALLERSPGPTRAIIYTHSHIDHVGGASVWIEPQTEIWATERFLEHFVKQYGFFARAETARGSRQFGRSLSDADVPCSALGKRPSFAEDTGQGFRPPTRTFSGATSFEVGGRRFELVEAHGETDDQLFVWLADERVLMPGDNFYTAFPNLYTIRGTRPRPINEWIDSLDRMRAKSARYLIPSHTTPISEEGKIRGALTDYRDAMQWLRDEVVRAANRGDSLEQVASGVTLPAHLAKKPWLAELYGQLDWSAHAYYTNELGWFDGDAALLYPPDDVELAKHEVALFGGAAKLRAQARALMERGDARLAVHFLSRLAVSGLVPSEERAALDTERAQGLRQVAQGVANSNGRAYLLESALELERREQPGLGRRVSPEIVEGLPASIFFDQMPARLIVDKSQVHESLVVRLSDPDQVYVITIRYGIAELVRDQTLPGTPKAIGTLATDARTWKRLALGLEQPALALAAGRLTFEGDLLAISRFLDRFERGP